MKTENGFTLIELLIAMAVSALVMGGIYSAYRSQVRAHVTQQEVVDMQQNIRAAMYSMERDIKMAGFDPTGNAGSSILIADTGELQFQIDENEDGDFTEAGSNDANEQLRYALTNDADGDGVADGTPCHLGREIWGGGLQRVAENIEALDFVYLDEDGNSLATPVANPEDIRSIQIALVARSGENVPVHFIKYADTRVYRNQQDQVILPAQNDNFRRILLTAEVKCRNLGLN